MNKKGVTYETMRIMVAVLFLVTMGFAIERVTEITADENIVKSCQISLLANDKARTGEVFGVETQEKVAINCPKENLLITMDMLEDLEESHLVSKEFALKYILANQLAKCKEKTSFPGIDELKPFNVDYLQLEKDKFCIYCSDIVFDEDIEEEIPSINDFMWFLNTQKMDNGKTYLKYIKGVNLTEEDYKKMKGEGFVDNIITESSYSTIYSIEKSGRFWQASDSLAGAASIGLPGCKLGGIISRVPYFGIPIGTAICGGSIIAGATWGYKVGEAFVEETTSYYFVKEENVAGLGCNPLYQ
ncbi:hypothetical protein HQ529_05605 [Candidatus Woesearchaeota archaeon]|nr:hypothetical protein [Candidatus Woesearchaeota archaeon]